MGLLEQYIQPGWSIRPLTPEEKKVFGKYQDEGWIHVDCKVNCYGGIDTGRSIWIRQDWLDAVKAGYYMA